MTAKKLLKFSSIHQCYRDREEIELYDIIADYFVIFNIKRTEEKLIKISKGKICTYQVVFIILHKYFPLTISS